MTVVEMEEEYKAEIERLKKEIEIREEHFEKLCDKYDNLKEALRLIMESV